MFEPAKLQMNCARARGTSTRRRAADGRPAVTDSGIVPGAVLLKEVRARAELLAAKPQKPLAEMKARINAIARTGTPEVNAMTEGFLDRG